MQWPVNSCSGGLHGVLLRLHGVLLWGGLHGDQLMLKEDEDGMEDDWKQ